MNTELLMYLAREMTRALDAKDKRAADEILTAALATAQAHTLSN